MHVLLVHGLGRSPLSVALLAHRLRAGGHTTVTFGYFAAVQSYADIVGRLVGHVQQIDAAHAPWAAVGHSLGGLLLRDAITTAAPAHLAHLVMLATPNRLPRMASQAARVAPFRWFAGECGQRLATPGYFASLPRPRVPHTIFAGTRGISGRWSPFGDEPNDGIVAVSETVLDPDSPPVLVPASHTFIMNHTIVQEAILAILAGRR
jgi:hypothetical protein